MGVLRRSRLKQTVSHFQDCQIVQHLVGGADCICMRDSPLTGAAGGGGFGGFEDRDHFSIFVGELSDDVTEEALMGVFTQYFRSVRSAKVCSRDHHLHPQGKEPGCRPFSKVMLAQCAGHVKSSSWIPYLGNGGERNTHNACLYTPCTTRPDIRLCTSH